LRVTSGSAVREHGRADDNLRDKVAVTLTDAPSSDMSGPAETVTARADCRAALRTESGRDLAEVIRDSDGRVSKVCIDLSRHYELGTELEDPIFVLC
jgi:hypothetical protein